jgi:16S rRNA (cytosine967-C5)-methyltransferase
MRLPPLLVTSTEEALREVLRFDAAADGVISRYFREHPKLGSRERAMLAESVYAVLRNRLVFNNFAESGIGAMNRRLALLGLAEVAGHEALAGLSDTEREWLARIGTIDRTSLPLEMRLNLPHWLHVKLVSQYGQAQAIQLAEGLNLPAPLDLRVNIVKMERDAALAALTAVPVACVPTPYSPHGIRLHAKPSLQNFVLFKEGAIEVQDEGSQLLSLLAGAKRGQMVVDFCAGAGGKTLALGAAMRNTGRLYAFDVSEKRLARLKPRLARSGLSNVHPVLIAHENDVKIKRLAGKIDRVLVDAPCSGLGSLRRNPDMKWRQTEEGIAEMRSRQRSILEGAARLVKPGGRLTYATCSILQEENEEVVDEFLSARDDFVLIPMSQVLEELKIALPMEHYLRLAPHLHGTDGFFAAVMERRQ